MGATTATNAARLQLASSSDFLATCGPRQSSAAYPSQTCGVLTRQSMICVPLLLFVSMVCLRTAFCNFACCSCQNRGRSQTSTTRTRRPIRGGMPYVMEFNKHYAKALSSGSLTGLDETMCPWEGAEGDGAQACPHKHFTPRKLKDLGAELNTQADGQCGGIDRIDIERGVSGTTEREFQEEIHVCAQ
eukprot:6202276-Pleurochrysis_carterae.AAC.1